MTVRLLLALACVAVPAWVLATRWSAVLDGVPTIDRASAQRQIVDAGREFVDGIR